MNDRPLQFHLESFVAQREWAVDGIVVLTANITLPRPVPATNRIARRIDRYYQLQSRSYLRYCESWLFPQAVTEYHAALASSTPLPHFTADLTYQITYQAENCLSLYTQTKESCGSTVLMVRRGDTWNLQNGYPVMRSSLFPSKQN